LIGTEEFTGGHVRLMPGDTFLFFTDGIYEAANEQGEEFGVSRIEAILKKLVYRGAHEMVDGVMDAVREFVGDRSVIDDICVVAVEVTDKAATDTHA
jgi:sigma-B regulation protein RsbU (phosphoserine phosphatase)